MKLLIADDDKQIRDGMQEGIDWKSLHFTEIYVASNGVEAFELFKKHLPEIVLSDVRMSGFDGLELLKKIKEIAPNTRVVIISGYADFDYVKTAIRHDAVDYELKPIKIRKLIALIKRLQEDIMKELQSEERIKEYKEAYRREFIEHFMQGTLSDPNIIWENLLEHYGFRASGTIHCAVLECELQPGCTTDSAHVWEVVQAVLDKNNDFTFLSLFYKEHKILLIPAPISELFRLNLIHSLQSHLRMINKELEKVHVYAGISSAGGIQDTSSLFEQAKSALSQKFFYESIYFFDFISSSKTCDKIQFNHAAFKNCLTDSNPSGAMQLLTMFLEGNQNWSSYNYDGIINFCCDVIDSFFAAITPIGITTGEEQAELKRQFASVKYMHLSQCSNKLLQLLTQESNQYFNKQTAGCSPCISQAASYLNSHYMEDLTVEVLAKKVGISANYFSSLFKKELNYSFVDFLTMLRIEHAKELIRNTSMKYYAVGQKVGYQNYAYFSKVFKSHVGLTLSEYRRECSKKIVMPF